MSDLNPAYRVNAMPRIRGALRYRCPVTQSFVLLTDEATLASLAYSPARLPCVACGEVHLMSQDPDVADPDVIVATSPRS